MNEIDLELLRIAQDLAKEAAERYGIGYTVDVIVTNYYDLKNKIENYSSNTNDKH